ncbi:DUF418 domain-containing protein [Staphylococcus chromogenes]|nr:DUF418 domain-containing protein [Staphylococcus chromogenes]
MRFASAAAHSGGVLNVLGNWGLCILVLPGCHLLAQWAPLRKLVYPANAVGRCFISAYLLHLIAVFVKFSPSISPHAAQEFADYLPVGTHLEFIGVELLGIFVFCALWGRMLPLGPVELLSCWIVAKWVPKSA